LVRRVRNRLAAKCQKYSPVRAAVEAVAEHDVGLVLEDGLEQQGVVARIVLEVGVLDEDDVAGHVSQPGADGGALALVTLVDDQLHLVRHGGEEVLQHATRVIGGRVVHHHELLAEPDRGLRYPPDDLGHRSGLVVHGHQHRQRRERHVSVTRDAGGAGDRPVGPRPRPGRRRR
jgi:hypothetical protein